MKQLSIATLFIATAISLSAIGAETEGTAGELKDGVR